MSTGADDAHRGAAAGRRTSGLTAALGRPASGGAPPTLASGEQVGRVLEGQAVRLGHRSGHQVAGERGQPVGLEYWIRLRCLRIFVDEAAEDRASTDPSGGGRYDVHGTVRWSLVQ
jgi:hypothetical protein